MTNAPLLPLTPFGRIAVRDPRPIRRLALAVTAALTLTSLPIYAAPPTAKKESEPSLEDTQDFIRRRLPQMARVYFTITQNDGAVQVWTINADDVYVGDGVLSASIHTDIRTTWPQGNWQSMSSTDKYTVKLGDLNPIGVTSRPLTRNNIAPPVPLATTFIVGVQCSKTANCIRDQATKFGGSNETSSKDAFAFEVFSGDDASRLAKAFSHLITLSGGKASKDPF
jgi:hypothetical protein